MLTRRQLQSTDPYDFEELVAMVWENEGYATTVRNKSGDKGIDIEARRGERKEVIQVKRYHDDNKIGSQKIREYATLYQQTNADDVVIVTSGYFTDPALELAQDLAVTTVNGDDLVKRIDQDTLEHIDSTAETAAGENLPDSGWVHAFTMVIFLGLPGAFLFISLQFILEFLFGLVEIADYGMNWGAIMNLITGSWIFFILIGGYYGLKIEHFSPSYWQSDEPQISLDKLREHLQTDDPAIRAKTTKIIAQLAQDDPERVRPIVDDLQEYVGDSNSEVRKNVTIALAAVAEEFPGTVRPLLGDLCDRFDDDQDKVHSTAIAAVAGIADEYPEDVRPFVESIRTYLTNDHKLVRQNATLVMERVLPEYPELSERFIEDLRPGLTDPSERVRVNTVSVFFVIARTRPKVLLPLVSDLIDCLNDDDYRVRSRVPLVLAILAYEYNAPNEIAQEIHPLLEDENKSVRTNATKAIRTIQSYEY